MLEAKNDRKTGADMKKELDLSFGGAYDVIVVGAGTAGVFAAISAARRGAKTLLVEKNALPGGTGPPRRNTSALQTCRLTRPLSPETT